MSAAPALLPCPHCSCAAWLHSHGNVFDDGRTGYRVECEGVCHSMTCYWHSSVEAIAAWNRRPAPAPGLEEAVEAARRIIDWVELTGEGPSDAWPTTCGDAIAIARALLALTRGDGRELEVPSGRDDRSDEHQKPDVLELPDDLRIPLHELQADAGYLIGLVANKPAIMRSPVLQSLETKLSQVAEAAYRLNGERADMLNALKSLVEVDDDDVKVTGAEVRERLARARNLIAPPN